jgi:hypothetical protein
MVSSTLLVIMLMLECYPPCEGDREVCICLLKRYLWSKVLPYVCGAVGSRPAFGDV